MQCDPCHFLLESVEIGFIGFAIDMWQISFPLVHPATAPPPTSLWGNATVAAMHCSPIKDDAANKQHHEHGWLQHLLMHVLHSFVELSVQ